MTDDSYAWSNEAMRKMNEDVEATLADLFARYEASDEEISEEARNELDEYAYGEGAKIVVTFTVAGGGPSQWITATYDARAILEEVEITATYAEGKHVRRAPDGSGIAKFAERYGNRVVQDLLEEGGSR